MTTIARKIIVKTFVHIVARGVKAELSKDFSCNPFEQIVYYPTDFSQVEDFGFNRHLSQAHNYINIHSEYMFALLHEIGHALDAYDECDIESEKLTRAFCQYISTEQARTDTAIQNEYFNLPTEFSATEFAINYIESHPIITKIFSRIFAKYFDKPIDNRIKS